MTSLNGKPHICRIPGCGAQAHGNLLCRAHYDQERYEATTGQSPEAKAEAEREQRIYAELTLGSSPSVFESDKERQAAWDARKDELMEAKYTGQPHCLGHRPWAWWTYEAERPEHLSEYPLDFDDFESPVEEQADLVDEWEIEPTVWLAAHGYLSPEEIAAISEEANIARARIGTDGEQIGSGGVDRVDVRAVKLYERVTDALKPNPPT